MESKKQTLSEYLYDQERKSDDMAISTLQRFHYENIIKPYEESDKIIDLHTHTNYSDGELSPNELIRLAVKNKIGILAITDHDTVEGLNNIDYNMLELKHLRLIPGIELNAKENKGTMHILGYNIDKDNIPLNQKLYELRSTNANRIISILEQIKKDYNIVFDYEDLRTLFTAKHNLGRPDIAILCVKNGYANSVQDAFDKYLKEANNKVRGKNKVLTYQECITLILNSGGIPVLAHPKTLELTEKELLILIKEMVSYGLQGIEVYHSTHTKEEIELYLYIANKYNLLISGGSDYHGITVKPDIELGTGRNNNLKIKKLSLLDVIK